MSELIKGDFQGKPTKFFAGVGKKGPVVQVDFVIVGGPYDGRHVPYEGNFSDKGTKYTKRALLAMGWTGKTIKTAEADIMTSPRVVPIEIEIATWNKDDGTVKEWSTVRNVGLYVPALAPLGDKARDVDSWLAAVPDEASPEPAPSQGWNGNRQSDVPF